MFREELLQLLSFVPLGASNSKVKNLCPWFWKNQSFKEKSLQICARGKATWRNLFTWIFSKESVQVIRKGDLWVRRWTFSLSPLGSHVEWNLWIATWHMEKYSGVPDRNTWISSLALFLLTCLILWTNYLFSPSLYFLIGNSGISIGTSLDYLCTKYYKKVFRALPNTQNINKKCWLPLLDVLRALVGYQYSCIKRKIYFVFIHLTIILSAYWTIYTGSKMIRQEAHSLGDRTHI